VIARLRLGPSLALCATLAAAAAGCGRALDSAGDPAHSLAAGGGAAPTAPFVWSTPPEAGAAGADGAFYPLEPGNRWHYAREIRLTIRPFGGGDPRHIVLRSTIERTLSCVEESSGRAYVAERSVETTGSGTTYYWVLFRQDRSGLYEADVLLDPPECEGLVADEEAIRLSRDPVRGDAVMGALSAEIADPAVRSAFLTAWERLRARLDAARGALASGGGAVALAKRGGGPGAGEITRLRYPLHPGAAWVILDAPRFDAVVEGVDALRLPVGHLPGYRIRIESELFGPQDRVRVWFGRSGQLMLAFYGESLATDPNGDPIGILIAEESQHLDGLDLAGPGRF
jgi:hypothetical protein